MRRLKRHHKHLCKTSRTIQMIFVSLMVGIAERAPLGIVQILYAQKVTKHDIMATLSLVTTFLMFGLKVLKSADIFGL